MSLLNLIKNKYVYSLIFIIITLVGVLFSYQYLFQTFFAMDEWSFWMQYLKYGPFYTITSAGPTTAFTGGIRFGLALTNDIYFSLFGLSITPWHFSFLALHLLNIFLVYKVLRKFKLMPFSAFLASFFFAIASAGQEAISWPAAGFQILGSTPFILLTILLTMNFIDSKKKKYLVLAVITSYLSFLMRPTGIVTAGLIVILIFLFYKRPNVLKIPKFVMILGSGVVLLGLFRLFTEYGDKIEILLKGGFNVIFYPLVSLSHIFIPLRLMFRISDSFINFYYPLVSKDPNVSTISHLIVGDFISVVISIFILILIFILYRSVGKFEKKVIVFGLLFYFLQFFVIALFYTDRGGLSYLEPRHMYLPVIGVAIIFGVFFNKLIEKYKTTKSMRKYIYILVFVLFGLWLCKEMTITRREVLFQAIDDIAIKKTWESLQAVKTPNSKKVIVYQTSDRSYFYPDFHLPFKIRAAYMLPLAFNGKPFVDKCQLGKLNFNNTYNECNGTQFGYFTEMEELVPLIKSKKIDKNNVIGLHFVDGSYEFKDTTGETQNIIKEKLGEGL